MGMWKLYWIESDGLEDCFVVAKNSQSAKRIEKQMNGFNDEDLIVTKIMDIPNEFEEMANKKLQNSLSNEKHKKCTDISTIKAWPNYAEKWLLKELGAEYRIINGKEEILINDTVVSSEHIYSVGVKAMKEIA